MYGPYFPEFGSNTGKYGPEKTPHLDTFHAVNIHQMIITLINTNSVRNNLGALVSEIQGILTY